MPVAAVMGIASVGSAAIGASAAGKAAKTQANAANNAANIQLQMFDKTQAGLAPFRDFGTGALSPYAQLLGIGSSTPQPDWNAYLRMNPDVMQEAIKEGVDPLKYAQQHYQMFGAKEGRKVAMTRPQSQGQAMQTALENIPGYQFVRDQGVKNTVNTFAGRGLSGPQAKGVARFVTGLANSTYGDQVGRLANAAALGENAAAGVGTAAIQTGQNVGNAYQAAGQATAAGQVGQANALQSGLYGLSNSYLTSKLLGGGMGGGAGAGSASPPTVVQNSGGFYGDGGYYG
ncbi:MAG TPA: hypothetical protein VF495_26330 [Phenylobacterium sp.]